MKPTYLAEWYEDDAFDYEGDVAVDFNTDVTHTSDHDSLDDAKRAAFINASRNNAVGIAYAHIIQAPLSTEENVLFVNELYNNKWNGWEEPS